MKVGVVGAGLTGLSLSHYLAAAGVDSVALEATAEPGGVIRSTEMDGVTVELGPQRMRLGPTIESLVDELGLRDELVTAPAGLPLYVYANGRLSEAPFSLETFLETDLLSWPGKARVLLEPLTADGRAGETAAELFSRKFGREAYENLVGPLFGGTYGSDPDAMPARHALSGLLDLEAREGNLLKPVLRRAYRRTVDGETTPAISFTRGLQTLPEALYEANADRVRLETPVETIREADDGYALVTADETVEVDEVVLTTPADVSADLLADVAPEAVDPLAGLDYNPLAMVYVRADCDREGFGYQIRQDEGFDTLGVSWNDSMFGRDGLYTCFVGGMKNPDLVAASDERLEEIVTSEFEEIMGCPADLLDVNRLPRGFPAWDASWDALDDVSLPDGLTLATNYTARMGIPSRIREAKSLAESLAGE